MHQQIGSFLDVSRLWGALMSDGLGTEIHSPNHETAEKQQTY